MRVRVAMVSVLFILSLATVSGVSAGEQFVVVQVENPRYCGNELFCAFENYHSPEPQRPWTVLIPSAASESPKMPLEVPIRR